MLLISLLACQTVPDPAPTEATSASAVDPFAAIAAEYTDYHLAVSAEAPPGVWMLCRMPITGVDVPYHADEVDTRITVYANDTAWPAMQETGARRFPPGSVIVKHKKGGDLGVMRKPAEGGDWQYAYITTSGEVQADTASMSPCASCHADGTVPESVRATAGPVVLTEPRDAVFLSASRSGTP